jgi:hypothetical protein
MDKIKVQYTGGESRYQPGVAVDYMLADVDGTELYAERPTAVDEYTNYNELRDDILESARTNGIDTDRLIFWYD